MSSLSRRACYKCGNVGHYAEVCSSAERLCYNCKQPGHESNGCPLPRTTEAKQCYHCQGLGHAQAMKCYACGKLGHISRDCTAPNGGPLNTAGKTCYQCGEAGHISRDCPQKNAPGVGEIPQEVDISSVPAPPVASIAPVA
ncbi:hexamer-binding protein HEXBP [Fusarium fujikuroi]|nr:hexamer-binding protein HEXBP [Fusarium fujikuroi]